MKFVTFPQANSKIKGEHGNPGSAIPFYTDTKISIVCVELTPEDLAQMHATKKLFVLSATPLPAPVQFIAKDPFVNEKKG